MNPLDNAIRLREQGRLEEAKSVLLKLLADDPLNPSVWYQCAWIHDVMELEEEAVPYYVKSIELGLKGQDRLGAYIGLGSTYRAIGRIEDSQAVLDKAIHEFPGQRELQVFYAMVHYNRKEYGKAMEILLGQLAETSRDDGIQAYKKAFLYYANKLDQLWSESVDLNSLLIKPLNPDQDPPWDLLLLADPAKHLVEEYVSRGICYTAFIGEELVGEFVLIRTHPQTIEIVNIAVKERFQGRGIGQALVLRAIEEAKNRNAKTIEIGTGSSGMKQLKLYQKCGFRMFAVDTDFFVKHYEEEIFEDGIRLRDMVRLRLEL